MSGNILTKKGVKMKKKALAFLGAFLILSSFTACQNKVDSQNDSASIINFTDTGENSSNIASKRANVEHFSSDFDDTVTSQECSDTISKKNDKTAEDKNSDSDTKDKKSNNNTSHSSDVTSGANSDSDNRNNNSNSPVQSEVNGNTNQNDNSKPQNTNPDSDTVSTDTSSDTLTDADTDIVASQPNNEEPVETGEFSEEDIAFYVNGTRLLLREELGVAVEILGEPGTIDSDESGIISMTYNYPGFWVKFVRSEDSEIFTIDAIQIYSDDFETEKGVKVFMSLDEAKRVYGECSTVIDNEYRYYVGDIYMYFYAPNGTVANIGYNIDYNVEHKNS